MLAKVSTVPVLVLVVLLLSIGLTTPAQVLATALIYFLVCAAIFSVSGDPTLAASVIFCRTLVVAVAALYIQPVLEVETGTDAQLYHAAGVQISHVLLTSGTLSGSGEGWGTNFYAIFTGVWYALCGTSQLRIMMFNSLVGGIGGFLFYRTFTEHYGSPHWGLKYLILFDPAVLYWSSTHGKDPFTFFFLGFLFRSFSRMLRIGGTRSSIHYLLALAGISILRPQVALVCVFSALLCLTILRLRSAFPNLALRFCFRSSLMAAVLIVIVVLVAYGNVEEFSSAGVLSQLSTVVGSISYGGTALEIPDFSTWTDVLKYMPVGMAVVLFRPFPWEQGNAFIHLAALQQLLLSSAVLLILWSIIERFLSTRSKNLMKASIDPLSIFILIYCLGFVSLYGIISGNLGTLVREKIQLVPFIWCAAFAVIRFRRAPVSDVCIL